MGMILIASDRSRGICMRSNGRQQEGLSRNERQLPRCGLPVPGLRQPAGRSLRSAGMRRQGSGVYFLEVVREEISYVKPECKGLNRAVDLSSW